MNGSGVASDPLCRDRHFDSRRQTSNQPPTVVRVRSEQTEGCHARQSTDPHKLRGSKPQEGGLTSVLDTHGPRDSLLTVCSCGPKASGSGSLAQYYRHATSRPRKPQLTSAITVLFQANTRHAHGREFKLLVTCMPIECGEGAGRCGRRQPGSSVAWQVCLHHVLVASLAPDKRDNFAPRYPLELSVFL